MQEDELPSRALGRTCIKRKAQKKEDPLGNLSITFERRIKKGGGRRLTEGGGGNHLCIYYKRGGGGGIRSGAQLEGKEKVVSFRAVGSDTRTFTARNGGHSGKEGKRLLAFEIPAERGVRKLLEAGAFKLWGKEESYFPFPGGR